MAAVLGTVGGLAALGSTATGVGMLGSAKMQSAAAREGFQAQTHAAMRAAELQRQSNMDQLDYLRNQDRIDRESKRHQDRQNYGLSQDEIINVSNQVGDRAFNNRAELIARNLTDDRRYGENQKQWNTMRRLMGMPDKAESIYVNPEELRITAPVLRPFKPDPTDYSDPSDRNKNRLV